METKPVEKYRVIREIPRHFVHLLPEQCPRIQAGEICHYFDSGNIYLFEAREHYVPWIERRYVELWTAEMFEPIPDCSLAEHQHRNTF